MKFYSAESAHGSSSSTGFSNDTIVRVFESKLARDTYVKETPNISCHKITRSEVTTHAANYPLNGNHDGTPQPFSGEFWGICGDLDENSPSGQIGVVEVCTDYDGFRLIERFHK